MASSPTASQHHNSSTTNLLLTPPSSKQLQSTQDYSSGSGLRSRSKRTTQKPSPHNTQITTDRSDHIDFVAPPQAFMDASNTEQGHGRTSYRFLSYLQASFTDFKNYVHLGYEGLSTQNKLFLQLFPSSGMIILDIVYSDTVGDLLLGCITNAQETVVTMASVCRADKEKDCKQPMEIQIFGTQESRRTHKEIQKWLLSPNMKMIIQEAFLQSATFIITVYNNQKTMTTPQVITWTTLCVLHTFVRYLAATMETNNMDMQ